MWIEPIWRHEIASKRYGMSIRFSDQDHGWDWHAHAHKLRALLERFSRIHPRYASWYLMRESAQASYSFDLMADPDKVAGFQATEDPHPVNFSFLLWNGRDSDPQSSTGSKDDPEWVEGSYSAGSSDQTLIKNSFLLDLHPLPVPPASQLDGFLSLLQAIASERAVTWGTLSTQKYAMQHRVFPHRQWGGWMIFVPQPVRHQDIPQAARVIDIVGKGAAVVTTEEPFDDTNPAHVKRANEIEIRMVELELLPELYG